ncbi:MAG: toll/interleukin-1 receptor domain-containing protein [Desulfobacteraceae bacterium]|nr:toll/interleukin-1 receptor domain-containing protein [Desulfobacteraceae bacterium]
MKALKRAISKRKILNPIVVADSRSPKKSLAQKVKEGINNSDYIVPVLTKASINNQWVNQEIGYAEALGTKIKIFPIVEASILDKLKGFIHKNLELPYRFTSSKNKIKEANDFRRCCKLLLKGVQ